MRMRVALMLSGGKDSIFALDWCLEKGYEIAYVISVNSNLVRAIVSREIPDPILNSEVKP